MSAREKATLLEKTAERSWTAEGLGSIAIPELRVTPKGALWAFVESSDFRCDPDGYYFVNPPTKVPTGLKVPMLVDGEVVETDEFIVDTQAAFRRIVEEAGRHYHTHPEVWGRTTTTVFSDTVDTRVQSASGTYSAARAGNDLAALDPITASARFAGQLFSGGVYIIYEGFFKFDTSSIPDSDTVDSAVLSLYGSADNSTTDFSIEARIHDWGAAVETADWVAGADLGTKTLVATFATSGGWSTVAYNDFTSDAAFVSNVSKTGTTYILVNSDRHRLDTTPTGNEYVSAFFSDEAGTTKDPKLVVNHSAGAPPADKAARSIPNSRHAINRASVW